MRKKKNSLIYNEREVINDDLLLSDRAQRNLNVSNTNKGASNPSPAVEVSNIFSDPKQYNARYYKLGNQVKASTKRKENSFVSFGQSIQVSDLGKKKQTIPSFISYPQNIDSNSHRAGEPQEGKESEYIESLASFTQRGPVDETHSPFSKRKFKGDRKGTDRVSKQMTHNKRQKTQALQNINLFDFHQLQHIESEKQENDKIEDTEEKEKN